MATKLFQKTFKKNRAHGRQYGCQQSSTTEQNTLYVDPGFAAVLSFEGETL